MARGPARQQRQLPVRGQPGLRPWLRLCPTGWNQSRASRLRMAGCQGGQCLPKRNGALGWREVEVEMRMGSCFQGPETTARFGLVRGLGHRAAGSAFPTGP